LGKEEEAARTVEVVERKAAVVLRMKDVAGLDRGRTIFGEKDERVERFLLREKRQERVRAGEKKRVKKRKRSVVV
jgi:hypothetical protein